ncbi:hypothetical protein OTU49_013113, partial [Cherax quadricarinatus]
MAMLLWAILFSLSSTHGSQTFSSLSGRALVPSHTTTTTTTLMNPEPLYPNPLVAGIGSSGSSGMFTPPARFSNLVLPSFANTTATNVTVIRGKTAYLHC